MHPSSPLIPNVIDASLFADDDGTVYFLSQNGLIAPMNSSMTGLAATPQLLTAANGQPVGFEGVFLAKINGRYILDCAISTMATTTV